MTIKLSRSNPELKAMLEKTFPDYTGRKFAIQPSVKYYMADYWDGGTRHYAKAVDMTTGEVINPTRNANIPWYKEANATIDIPENMMIVEHCIFCGHDCGITFYVNPAALNQYLPLTK